MKFQRFMSVTAMCGVLAVGAAACGDSDEPASSGSSTGAEQSGPKLSGSLAGAGSSAQAAAQEAWIAGFQEANGDVTVSYDPVGSGGGREQFVAGGVAFAGSDAPLEDDELTKAQERCGGQDNLIEAPTYISPIAIAYNLEGVDSLQLKPATIAKIFSGKITKWDDAAIKADNPDADLPGDRITVVHRSDDSGTTENFTDYLSKAAKSDWSYEVSGDWPKEIKGQEAAEGTSGVVEAIKGGKGTIGYADASQAGELGKAKVGVGTGDDYAEPTPEAAAKVIDESKETSDAGKNTFVFEVNRQPEDASIYPVVLASYFIACTKYDDTKQADLVKGYLGYVASEQGQQAGAENAGSAPITDKLRQQVQGAVDAIGSAS